MMHRIRSKLPFFHAVWIAIAFIAMAGLNQADAASQMTQNQYIEPGTIREAVEKYIERSAPWDPAQMHIKAIKYHHRLKVPAGRFALRVSAPKHTDWIGATPFFVQIMIHGEPVKRVTVPVNIEVWTDVIVSSKPLSKYQPIGRDDVQIKRMNLARTGNHVVVRLDQALGRRTNRKIAAGCVLRKDQIESPPLVKRGDIVQVVAQSSVMKISVKGMAKQNGGDGERIKVINLRSKKTIYAQVVDAHTVKVDF